MDKRDELLAVYKARAKNEIDEIKAEGRPVAVEFLPDDAEADALLLMRWHAAMRDSLMLCDSGEVYEKHVDNLTLSDAGKAGAFLDLTRAALFRSANQHRFAADVKKDLKGLGGDHG